MGGKRKRLRQQWGLWVSVGAVTGAATPVWSQASMAAAGAAPASAEAAEQAAMKPVSLLEAIQTAYQFHGRVASAVEDVESAKHRVREAKTGIRPNIIGQLGYSGSGIWDLGNIFGNVGRPDGTGLQRFDQGLQPRVGINYTLYDGGLTRTLVRSAKALQGASQANLDVVRNEMAFQVTTAFLGQLRAQRLLDLRKLQLKLAEEQLGRVDARIRLGSAPESDRALALSDVRNREVDVIVADNNVRVAGNSLRNIMGLAVGPGLHLVELAEHSEAPPPLETLREIARRERPEVSRSEAQVRNAEAGVTTAKIGRKPRLDTRFTFNTTPNNEVNRSDYTVSAVVAMPLWDGGRTHARELGARADLRGSVADRDQAIRDVVADVDEAFYNLVSSQQRVQASKLAAEAARVNLENSAARYANNAPGASVVEVLTAQTQFATANNNAINALYDALLAQAQLNRAIGRI